MAGEDGPPAGISRGKCPGRQGVPCCGVAAVREMPLCEARRGDGYCVSNFPVSREPSGLLVIVFNGIGLACVDDPPDGREVKAHAEGARPYDPLVFAGYSTLVRVSLLRVGHFAGIR
jgi:hypothetical protein